jgi:hypothetical protein
MGLGNFQGISLREGIAAMWKAVWAAAINMLLAALMFGQASSSVSGTVTDPSGAAVPNAKVDLSNGETGARRGTVSDSSGRYSFLTVQPGTYELSAVAPGFNNVVVSNVTLLVNNPATINLSFTNLGSVSTAVMVSAETSQVNTTDATIGNAIGGQVITQLPFEGRNVVGLLSIQPGVVYLGEPDPAKLNDYRSGAVNGNKSDQGNVTLDGVDVNDNVNGAAFKSVLRTTLDSVQEFRTITTNAGAEMGRSSGAQVSLVTKSGSNTVHGSAYEYIRNTATSANSFFNNSSGVSRPQLNRNVFGASVGGPIQKNRLFYFLNYEGRRDASQSTALRIVPNDAFRQGIFTYVEKNGSIGTLSPSQVKALDPQGIGVGVAVLTDFQKYPHPNDTSTGDGLNTSGYRFNASTPLRWNTYIARVDYTLDSAGKHQFFWRGNLQNDNYANGMLQFPGQPASSVYLENSKGFALGYTAILSPALVNNFRYGFTRQGVETTGVLNAPYSYFTNIDTLYATTRDAATIAPVHTIADDMVWTKGAHTVSFGGVVRLMGNQTSGPGTFSNALAKSVWYLNDGTDLLPADAKASTAGENQMLNLLGILSQLTTNQQYDKTGAKLAQGLSINRNWLQHVGEMYLQDSWKVTRSLTVSAGFRLGLSPAVYEANGYQTSPTIPLADLFNTRYQLANSGQPQSLAPPVAFDLASASGSRGLYPFQVQPAPRVSIAYSPQGSDSWSKFFFGGPGKTSIRAGWGMFYDNFGQSLARNFSTIQLGLSTSLRNSANQPADVLPRYSGFYSVPSGYFPVAPAGGFPQTYPPIGGNTMSIDDQLKSPYTMNTTFSIQRELKGGFMLEASFVDRQARRSLIGDDLMQPTNLVDSSSGMTYFQAAQALALMANAGTNVSNVAKIPFWENLWPGAASNGLTATQNIYKMFQNVHGDYTTALYNIDRSCNPSCSKFGPYSMYSAQYLTLYGFRSLGKSSYDGLQTTVRKRFSEGYQLDFNFTWSKCIDLGSNRETAGSETSSNAIVNSWFTGQTRAVCDYDTTRVVSALALAQLPFGKGKRFLGNANAFVNGLIGGWQLSGIVRNTSGFPLGVDNGVGYPTSWAFNGWATQTGVVPNQATTMLGNGVSMFSSSSQAFAAYSATLPGEVGQRNGIRGDGMFGIDLALGKRFNLYKIKDQQHSLQIRAEVFNLTNSVRFDVSTANLDIANEAKFGLYTQTLTQPRVFQFSGRYEF